jgi:uncharacterized protein (DUF433 family)
MNWRDYISITPGIRSGKPCVKGTRITVSDVLEYLASGMDEQAILTDIPELRREHIQAVLGFAAERERRLSALSEPPPPCSGPGRDRRSAYAAVSLSAEQ